MTFGPDRNTSTARDNLHGIVRPIRSSDLDGLCELAAMTGGGMTNLPDDRYALAAKVADSERSIADPMGGAGFYLLVLENSITGEILGTACLYGKLGTQWPFYSYKIGISSQTSLALGRAVSMRLLYLVNDFDGASEVGGLFLRPDARINGLGRLLARSRYLFVARHRDRFADRMVAELRGWVEDGISPFWEAVGKPFFGSDFLDADRYNALHGNQFIADLMPRYPLYIAMLPRAAQDAIGRAHAQSVPAMRLLEGEGFVDDGYVDIFDAGPTLSARTDHLVAIRDARSAEVHLSDELPHTHRRLIASGIDQGFRVWAAEAEDIAGRLRLFAEDPRHGHLVNGEGLLHVAL